MFGEYFIIKIYHMQIIVFPFPPLSANQQSSEKTGIS